MTYGLEFERSGFWKSLDEVLPKSSGVYLVKYLVPFVEEIDIAALIFDAVTNTWLDILGNGYSCVSWMPFPYPYQGIRAPGYCS